MRYRLVDQVISDAAGAIGFDISGLRRSRLLGADDEGVAALCDAVDGVEQLAHGGDEHELWRLADRAEAIMEGLEPRIDADCGEHRHPECAAQLCIAECRCGPGGRALSRLPKPGHDTDVSREGTGASEAGRIADGSNDACRGMRADTIYADEQSADLMGVEQPLDIGLDFLQATAPEVEVLTDMAGLHLVDRPTMLTDRAFSRSDEAHGAIEPDFVPAVVAQPRQPARIGAGEDLGGRALGNERRGEHRVQTC